MLFDNKVGLLYQCKEAVVPYDTRTGNIGTPVRISGPEAIATVTEDSSCWTLLEKSFIRLTRESHWEGISWILLWFHVGEFYDWRWLFPPTTTGEIPRIETTSIHFLHRPHARFRLCEQRRFIQDSRLDWLSYETRQDFQSFHADIKGVILLFRGFQYPMRCEAGLCACSYLILYSFTAMLKSAFWASTETSDVNLHTRTNIRLFSASTESEIKSPGGTHYIRLVEK